MSNPLNKINETLQGMSTGSGSGSASEVAKLEAIASKIEANTTALGTLATKLEAIATKLEAIDGHLNPLYSADYVAPESPDGGES